ncbi:MAG: hypothetical protein NWR30_09315 [Salibacteraceae bacterium]|jgi:hypothetical protein|nr:hypothetical protein [Salibacteraceae bacterium]MDP4843663.1 hypothetical protein [Salibacteraceae bacterium]MDP4934900.1 hypothetical protein [Salibacteraceae bacterium]
MKFNRLFFAAAIATLLTQCNIAEPDNVQLAIEESSKTMNAKLPMMVDQITQLDSTNTSANRTLNYYYTLVGLDLDSILLNNDTGAINHFQKAMYRVLSENIIKGEEMAFYRENEATLAYHYYASSKDFLFDVIISPDHYKDFSKQTENTRK